jgi:hypothetical protein
MSFNVIPNASTDRAPAIVTFGTQTCVAWKNKSDATIWFSTSGDNVHWNKPGQIKGSGWSAETEQGPALAVGMGPENLQAPLGSPPVQNTLYAAWTGKSSKGVWYSQWDGKKWSQQANVGPVSLNPTRYAASDSAPLLTTLTGGVAMAWRALDDTINSIIFPSGVTSDFEPYGMSPNAETDQAPAVAAFGDGSAFYNPGLLFAWVKKSDNTLWYTNSPGAQPSNLQVKGSGFQSLSSAGPAICTTETSDESANPPIGLAWMGESGSVWVSKNFPSWTSLGSLVQQKVAGTSTNVAPAWLGIGQMLVFVAHNLKIDGNMVEDGSLWTCIP